MSNDLYMPCIQVFSIVFLSKMYKQLILPKIEYRDMILALKLL